MLCVVFVNMGKLIQDAHVPVINPVENKVRGCDDEAETQEPPEKRRKLTDGDLAIFEMLTWHLAFDGERGGRLRRPTRRAGELE